MRTIAWRVEWGDVDDDVAIQYLHVFCEFEDDVANVETAFVRRLLSALDTVARLIRGIGHEIYRQRALQARSGRDLNRDCSAPLVELVAVRFSHMLKNLAR